jgi:acyl-coenzyme A synthetase/AMP-(fatty) acid ligase
MYYISAMHAHVLPAMLGGAACVLVDTASPREYVALLEQHRVSWAYAVPSWWRLCLRVPELSTAALPALTRLAAGGAPFPADLQAALRERLPEVRLLDVYGLSETHSPGCIADDDDLRTRPRQRRPPAGLHGGPGARRRRRRAAARPPGRAVDARVAGHHRLRPRPGGHRGSRRRGLVRHR